MFQWYVFLVKIWVKYLSALMLQVSLSKHESKVGKKCKIVRLRLFSNCKLGSFWALVEVSTCAL